MTRSPTTLITGGAGFIGSTIARTLADSGHRVVLADVQPPRGESEFILDPVSDMVDVVTMPVDSWAMVTDEIRKCRPNYVIHLAAVTNPVALQRNPLIALRVNVEGTFNVLEAARQQEVARVIVFSSIGVLPTIQYEPVDANHPTIVATEGPGSGFYGAAKLASEAFALSYVSGFGLDVRIIRPSAVYGFGMNWPIFIKPMVEGAVRGEPVRLESGARFPRDYTHVADVAGLAHAVLDGPSDADRVFYAATGEPLVTAGELAEIVKDVVPGADIEIGDTLTDADVLELRYRGRISVENARSQLGWQPRFGDLREGVRQYVDEFRAYVTRGGGSA